VLALFVCHFGELTLPITLAQLQTILDADTSKHDAAMQKSAGLVRAYGTEAETTRGKSSGLKTALNEAFGGGWKNNIETGLGLIKGLVGGLNDFLAPARDAERLGAQLQARIESTGGAAGLTKERLLELADSLSAAGGLSAATDDAVLSAENLLLTFTSIKGSVFEDTTAAVLDVATAMNQGMAPATEKVTATALQLGKAINDPMQGLSALTRIGVSFTQQQKEQIATMQKSGDVMGAQRAVLAELNKEFGGSAAAAVDTYDGKVARLSQKFEDFQQVVGEKVLPAVEGAMDFLVDHTEEVTIAVGAMFAAWAISATAAAIPTVIAFAPVLAVLGAVALVGGGLVAIFKDLENKLPDSGRKAGGGWSEGIWTGVDDGREGIKSAVDDVVSEFERANAELAAIAARDLPKLPAGPSWGEYAGIAVAGIADASAGIHSGLMAQQQMMEEDLTGMFASAALITKQAADRAGAAEFVESFGDQLLGGLESLSPSVYASIKGMVDNGDLISAVTAAGNVLGTEPMLAMVNSAINEISNQSPAVQASLAGMLEDLRILSVSLSAGVGIDSATSFISSMVGGVASQAPNVQAILQWLVTNEGANSALLWAALGKDSAAVYAANLHAGIQLAMLQEADRLKGLSSKFAELHDGATSLIDQNWNKRADALIASATKGFAASLPGLVGLGILPKPTEPPKGPTGSGSGGSSTPRKATGGSGASSAAAAAKEQVKTSMEIMADVTGQVSDAIKAGVEAFTALANFTIPTNFDTKLTSFAAAVNTTVQSFGQIAQTYSAESLEHTAVFGDSTGKLMGGLKNSADLFEKLGPDWQKPTDEAMFAFRDAVWYQMDLFRTAVSQYDEETLALTSQYGEATGKLMGGLSAAANMLAMLDADWKKPSDAAMFAFRDAVWYQTDLFRAAVQQWDKSSLEQAALYGDSIGKLLNGVGAATDLFATLADPKFTVPPREAVERYFMSLDDVLDEFAAHRVDWQDKGTKESSELAKNVGDVVGGVAGSLDLFMKLADPKTVMPTREAIQAFFQSLDYALVLWSEESEAWKGRATEESAVLATNIGEIMAGVNAALEPLANIAAAQAVSPEQIEGALANLWTALHHFNEVMKSGELQGDWTGRAGSFAGAISAVFSALKEAGDLMDGSGKWADTFEGSMDRIGSSAERAAGRISDAIRSIPAWPSAPDTAVPATGGASMLGMGSSRSNRNELVLTIQDSRGRRISRDELAEMGFQMKVARR
jgi:hypothetical protein